MGKVGEGEGVPLDSPYYYPPFNCVGLWSLPPDDLQEWFKCV